MIQTTTELSIGQMEILSGFLTYMSKHKLTTSVSFEQTEYGLFPTEESATKITKMIGMTHSQGDYGDKYSAHTQYGTGSFTNRTDREYSLGEIVVLVVHCLNNLEQGSTFRYGEK